MVAQLSVRTHSTLHLRVSQNDTITHHIFTINKTLSRHVIVSTRTLCSAMLTKQTNKDHHFYTHVSKTACAVKNRWYSNW